MQTENSFLDQVARLMSNAAGAAKGLRDEVNTMLRTRAEKAINDFDLVQREDFEAMKRLTLRAIGSLETLEARLALLEKKLGASAGKAPVRILTPNRPKRTSRADRRRR